MSPAEYNGRALDTLPRWAVLALIEAGARVVQSAKGLKADGMVGPKTLAAMVQAPEDVPSSPNTLEAEVLKVAISELGDGAIAGNNEGRHVESYHRKILAPGAPRKLGPWCAAFVSWCCEEAATRLGVELPFRRSGSAKRLAKNVAKASGVSIMKKDTTPLPGDLIVFHRGSPLSWKGHIGIVECVQGGMVHTIEGNVGAYPAKVRRHAHDIEASDRFWCFVRLPVV